MPELCQRGDFSQEKKVKGIFVYVLEFILTLAKMQSNSNCEKSLKSEAEYFESFYRFSYCMHSSVYRVFWPTDWVID